MSQPSPVASGHDMRTSLSVSSSAPGIGLTPHVEQVSAELMGPNCDMPELC